LLFYEGNWQYSAGVGADPRNDRYFNVVKQGAMYDPEAVFIYAWCPELQHLPKAYVLDPTELTDDIRLQYNLSQEIYPKPIVPLLHYTPLKAVQQLTEKLSKKKNKASKHGTIPVLK
jgi:deoxyribodipyrimidine photolyase